MKELVSWQSVILITFSRVVTVDSELSFSFEFDVSCNFHRLPDFKS